MPQPQRWIHLCIPNTIASVVPIPVNLYQWWPNSKSTLKTHTKLYKHNPTILIELKWHSKLNEVIKIVNIDFYQLIFIEFKFKPSTLNFPINYSKSTRLSWEPHEGVITQKLHFRGNKTNEIVIQPQYLLILIRVNHMNSKTF